MTENSGFNVALDSRHVNRSVWRRVFPGNQLVWQWQPNSDSEQKIRSISNTNNISHSQACPLCHRQNLKANMFS